MSAEPVFLLLLILMSRPATGQDNAPTLCFDEVGGKIVSVPCPGNAAGAMPRKSAPVPVQDNGSSDPFQIRERVARIATSENEADGLVLFEDLVGWGARAVPGLVTVFEDEKIPYEHRWVAGRALGRIPGEASVQALIRGLSDPVPMVRMAAATGLKDLGARSALPALIAALDDKAALVRASALDAIGVLGTPSNAPRVALELTAPHNFIKGTGLFVRVHAVQALERLGGPQAIAALITVADDPDPATREAARSALLKLSGLSQVPPGEGSVVDRWTAWWATRAPGPEAPSAPTR